MNISFASFMHCKLKISFFLIPYFILCVVSFTNRLHSFLSGFAWGFYLSLPVALIIIRWILKNNAACKETCHKNDAKRSHFNDLENCFCSVAILKQILQRRLFCIRNQNLGNTTMLHLKDLSSFIENKVQNSLIFVSEELRNVILIDISAKAIGMSKPIC